MIGLPPISNKLFLKIGVSKCYFLSHLTDLAMLFQTRIEFAIIYPNLF